MNMNEALIKRFLAVDPATVGHYIGGGYMKPEMKPIRRNDDRMIGPAYTVRISGRDSCALYYGIKHAPKGSVIVVDRCGDNTFACCGEMVATYAQSRGMAGIVIDGPATDSRAIEKLDMPVFCTGISAVTTMIYGATGEVQIPVVCAGAHVNPGDYVFGDADGVVVLPPDGYEDALKKAEESVARELTLREHFRSGGDPLWNVDQLFTVGLTDAIAELRKFNK